MRSSCSETGIVFCTLRACGTDVCSLLADPGPCRAAFPAYHFNQTSGRCEQFIYGGCQGNGNKFATIRDCRERCKPLSELIFGDDNGDDGANTCNGGNGAMKSTTGIFDGLINAGCLYYS